MSRICIQVLAPPFRALLHSKIAVTALIAEQYNHHISALVYVGHHLHLIVSFLDVALVDAYSVNPETNIFCFFPYMSKSSFEIDGDLTFIPIDYYRFGDSGITPAVGKCVERRRVCIVQGYCVNCTLHLRR
jgi:hypothetical protein